MLTSTAAKASRLALTKKGSTAASRSISGHYMGGNPDSRGTESEDGITEDNEHANLDDRLAHDATPLLMKIAQGDRDDMHKYWSNKHSPGNGFYTGKNDSISLIFVIPCPPSSVSSIRVRCFSFTYSIHPSY